MNQVQPEVKLTHNEVIKEAIPTLAGNIAATVASGTDQFSADDQQFIKFHGIYQQDDRDLRKTQKKFMMMIRGRIPGGIMTPAQWITFDDLATTYGNDTLRITTRQSIQFHGVVMSGLRPLIQKINDCLLSTLAACGDVNRNVMAAPTPAQDRAREAMIADVHRVVAALAPETKAYHSIWIDGVQLNLDDPANKDFVDPLYGKTYLPRKFKVRVGSALWHGVPKITALQLHADVLHTQPIGVGEIAGYHHTPAPFDGTLVVIGAGSAHGIAPNDTPSRQPLSPFHFARTRMTLLEPPHMHTSMVVVEAGAPTPRVGEWVDIQRPLITTQVDHVEWM